MRINPVLQKDMKTKLRGWRAPVLISCYIILLSIIMLLYFTAYDMFYPYGIVNYSPRMAVNAYNILLVFQFALLFVTVPAITATSISGERERQTLDLMLVTKTPPRKIVIGKIVISIAYTMLLFIASLPVLGVVFFFGGIGIEDIAKLTLFYVLTAFFVASSGVFFSTLFKRNITAIISTYLFLGTVTFGPFFLYLLHMSIKYSAGYSYAPTYTEILSILFPSPVFGYTSFYFGGVDYRGFDLWGQAAAYIDGYLAQETGILRFFKPWIANGLFSIIVSVLLIILSTLILNPVRRKK
ncbi:ABC transporter permease [Thermoclostridium stercorarium]|jgi:ABC-2 type transport system permease protein|nr:ABC transporter permease [Thermoclostridium stercorarium]